jgi:hypothetical protein
MTKVPAPRWVAPTNVPGDALGAWDRTARLAVLLLADRSPALLPVLVWLAARR